MRICPSSTPMVAGTAPAARTAASLATPVCDAVRCGEPVCDERRLERDDGALLLERRPHLVADVDQALASRPSLPLGRSGGHRARLLDAARAGGESRARARRRASRQRTHRRRPSSRRPRRPGRAASALRRMTQPADPRLTIQSLPAIGPPTIRSSSPFAKTTSGASSSRSTTELLAPKSRIALHDERSMLTRSPALRAS